MPEIRSRLETIPSCPATRRTERFEPALVRGLSDRATREIDRRLRQQAAVDAGPCPERDRCLREYDALGVRRGSERHCACDLPDDVLGLGAAREHHPGGCAECQIVTDLKDPGVVRSTG